MLLFGSACEDELLFGTFGELNGDSEPDEEPGEVTGDEFEELGDELCSGLEELLYSRGISDEELLEEELLGSGSFSLF